MTKKQQEEEEIDSVNITVLLKISLSRFPPGSLSPRSNGWVCARLCRWVSTGSWGSSCIACAGSWRLRKREEKKRHLVSRSQDRDAACPALAAPAPASLEKHGQPRRQRCPAGGCVCPGTNPPAHAQSALLSPLRLGVGFTQGRRCPLPTRSLGRSSILSTDACRTPFPVPSRGGGAALLTGWARGLLPRLPRCPASPAPNPGTGRGISTSGGMRSGHRRGNSPVWPAGTRFLPDLCCQSPLELALLPCGISRRVLMEEAEAGWEQPRSLDHLWSMPGAACSSSGPWHSQGSQWLGLHHADTSSVPPPSISSPGRRFVP